MERKKFFRRLFALFLCAAILLPVFPLLPTEVHAAVSASNILSGYPYSGGLGSNLLTYDCGNAITDDGATTCMRLIRNTTAAQFNTYLSLLAAKNELVYSANINSNETDKNMFRKYRAYDESYSIYTYYLAGYNEARIIVDTNSDTVEGFKYTEQSGTTVTPKMVMWGLSTSPTGYHLETGTPFSTDRENNGALIIIRMRDNSLFINDGGHLAQMSDDACDELLAFCRELTGTTGTSEKMVINCWFLSHAHDDHFMGFSRFINKNHEHFDLKNIAYNIDIERTDSTRDIHDAVHDLIAGHYPNVRYYKPHTGETFTIAGTKFDVMYTHEDALYSSSNTLKINDSDSGTTYRDGLYKSDGTTDFNDTSTVLRVTFPNGVDSILYGDMNLAESVLETVYPTSAMQADIMLVPHHGFDSHPDLVNYAGAKIYLYTQNKTCIYGPDDDVMTIDPYGTARSDLATSSTDMKRNFLAMFPGMKVRKGVTPSVKYQIYWGGNETAIIDINSLASASSRTTIGYCVETREAADHVYTGWSIDSLDDSIEGYITSSDYVTSYNRYTSVPWTYYVPAEEPLVQNERYLLMNYDKTYVMSYEALQTMAGPNPAKSLKLDYDGDSEGTFTFSGSNVYIDHAYRSDILWIMRQFSEATGGNTIGNTGKLVTSSDTNFGGGAVYHGIELQKGVRYTDLGVSYWSCTGGSNEYRYLYYRSNGVTYSTCLFKTVTEQEASARTKYYLESFSDGTFLLYFKMSATDYRFVCCDEYGNWGVRRYANGVDGCRSVSEISGDLYELKLRLYRHERDASTTKRVAFKGYENCYVQKGTSYSDALKIVQENIAVYDPNMKNLHIPYDASSDSVGCYRLEFDGGYSPYTAGTYPVDIIYCGEANSLGNEPYDVYIGTVNVVVHAHSWTGATCTTPKTCSGCGMTEGSALGHSYKAVVTAPTCTANGYTTHTCSTCGDSYTDSTVTATGHSYNAATCTKPKTCKTCGATSGSALGHSYSAATCTKPKTCTTCGATTGSALGHSYKAVVTAPTCTEAGYTTHTCSTCGHSYTDSTVAATGHSYNAATCTKPKTCKTCGATSGSALGHSYNAATCTKPKTCKTCGATSGSALGHSYNAATCTAPKTCKTCGVTTGSALGHSYQAVVTAPTCTEAGYTTHTCSGCGDSYTDSTVAATGHSYNAATCTKPKTCKTCGATIGSALGHSYNAATCTEPQTCTVCGATTGSALGHSYNAATCTKPQTCKTCGVTTGSALGHSYNAATCTKPKTCKTCGATTGSALGHSYNAATCTKPKTCKTCGATTGNALGHSYTSVVTAPTCTEAGYTTHTCSTCGDIYTDSTVAATGHSYNAATCTKPKTCKTCGTTSGNALGHSWVAATCTTAKTCSTCKITSGSALGHSYKAVVTAPTCTEAGYTTHTCSTCGNSYKDSTVPATGHSYNAATCTKPKTCKTCGATSGSALGHSWVAATCTTAKTCSTCKTTSGSALGHSYKSVVVEPTCMKAGSTTYTCTACGNSYQETMAATGIHSYGEDGYCIYGCRTTDPSVRPELTFAGAALKLEENLTILYYVDSRLFTDWRYENPYIVCTLNNVATTIDEYTVSGDHYVFSFRNIAPHQMNDAVGAVLYANRDGIDYESELLDYSVATYCYNTLERYSGNEYAKLRTLLVDLLNYGAASQTYLNYKTNALVNADLTETQKAWATQNERTLTTVQNVAYSTIDNPTVNWIGTTLKLSESVSMYFLVSTPDTQNLSVKVTDDEGHTVILDSSAFEPLGNGYHGFSYDGLNAGEMSKTVYLTVYQGSTPVSNTVRYSIESYAYKNQNSTDENLANLVKAMMKYGDAAKAY